MFIFAAKIQVFFKVNIAGKLSKKYLFSVSSWSIRFHSLLTSASCSCSRVFSSSTFSLRKVSKLVCLAVVSDSNFSIRLINLFTRHSCSCSSVCSSWTFSCRNWKKKKNFQKIRICQQSIFFQKIRIFQKLRTFKFFFFHTWLSFLDKSLVKHSSSCS